MPTTERITQNNTEENNKAREYLANHPRAVVGRINYFHNSGKEIKNLEDIMPLLNFAFDWAIPQKDDKLIKLIQDHNNAPFNGMGNITASVDKIFDRIEKLNGITFFWI